MENFGRGTETERLFKVRETVIRTLRAQKYAIPDGVDALTFEDFVRLFEKNRHHLYLPDIQPPDQVRDEKTDTIGVLVYFEPNMEFTKKVMESRVAAISAEYPKLSQLIFVLKKVGKINAFVSTALNKDTEFAHVRIMDNIFVFNFMQNIVMPEFKLLTEAEKEAVIKAYKTPLSNFQKMTVGDPVARFFNAKVGDMFSIVRDGGLERGFRVVV